MRLRFDVEHVKPLPYLDSIVSALVVFLAAACGPGGEEPPAEEESAAKQYLAYFGTYTQGDSEGIYAYRFDSGSGEMTSLGLAAEVANPSFLAIHPNRRFLYAVTEDFEGGGAVSAYTINHDTGKLTLLNQVSSNGNGPCHVNVDSTGQMIAVANYGAGSTASFPIKEDGSLGEAASVMQHEGSSVNEARQKGPHAHSVNFAPDNRFVVTAVPGDRRNRTSSGPIRRRVRSSRTIRRQPKCIRAAAPGTSPSTLRGNTAMRSTNCDSTVDGVFV